MCFLPVMFEMVPGGYSSPLPVTDGVPSNTRALGLLTKPAPHLIHGTLVESRGFRFDEYVDEIFHSYGSWSYMPQATLFDPQNRRHDHVLPTMLP
jgi:hypothetical protein